MEQGVAKFSCGPLGALPGATRWLRRRDPGRRPINFEIRNFRNVVPRTSDPPTVNREL